MLLNDYNKVNKEPKKKLKNTWGQMKKKINILKSMGYSKSSTKREVYSNTGLPQET